MFFPIFEKGVKELEAYIDTLKVFFNQKIDGISLTVKQQLHGQKEEYAEFVKMSHDALEDKINSVVEQQEIAKLAIDKNNGSLLESIDKISKVQQDMLLSLRQDLEKQQSTISGMSKKIEEVLENQKELQTNYTNILERMNIQEKRKAQDINLIASKFDGILSMTKASMDSSKNDMGVIKSAISVQNDTMRETKQMLDNSNKVTSKLLATQNKVINVTEQMMRHVDEYEGKILKGLDDNLKNMKDVSNKNESVLRESVEVISNMVEEIAAAKNSLQSNVVKISNAVNQADESARLVMLAAISNEIDNHLSKK